MKLTRTAESEDEIHIILQYWMRFSFPYISVKSSHLENWINWYKPNTFHSYLWNRNEFLFLLSFLKFCFLCGSVNKYTIQAGAFLWLLKADKLFFRHLEIMRLKWGQWDISFAQHLRATNNPCHQTKGRGFSVIFFNHCYKPEKHTAQMDQIHPVVL